MTWVKVDDKLHDHDKTFDAGLLAMGLWVLCATWSADNEKDGFVPERIARRFTTDTRQSVKKLAGRLVDAGFWIVTDGGWIMHDWSGYNPTKAQKDHKREQARDRMAAVRARQSDVRSASDRRQTVVSSTSDRDLHMVPEQRKEPFSEDMFARTALYPDPEPEEKNQKMTTSSSASAVSAIMTGELAIIGAGCQPPARRGTLSMLADKLITEWVNHVRAETGIEPPRQERINLRKNLLPLITEFGDEDLLRAALKQWDREGFPASTLAHVTYRIIRGPGISSPRIRESTTDNILLQGASIIARAAARDAQPKEITS